MRCPEHTLRVSTSSPHALAVIQGVFAPGACQRNGTSQIPGRKREGQQVMNISPWASDGGMDLKHARRV